MGTIIGHDGCAHIIEGIGYSWLYPILIRLNAVQVGDGAQDTQGGAHAGDVADDDAAAAILLPQVTPLGVAIDVVDDAPKGG